MSAPLSAKTCDSQSEWNGGSSGSSMIAGNPAIPPTSLMRLMRASWGSGPDGGHDDRRDGQCRGGADQAGRVERHLHQVVAEPARAQHVDRDEGDHLQDDPEI